MLLELMSEKINAEKEFEKILQKKFLCQSSFSQEIEKMVLTNESNSYIESIIEFCEKNNIDLESVPKLISKPLKEKIKYEAVNLNFLKKSSKAKLIF